MLRSGHAERFFALEVVEEGAFGHARRLAKLVDRARRKPFRADDVASGFEQARLCIAPFRVLYRGSWHAGYIPIGLYRRKL
jgi:hypothetical protein